MPVLPTFPMPAALQQLYTDLLHQLDQLVEASGYRLENIEHCLLAVKKSLQSLREHVQSRAFAHPAEEINFFKEIKPRFYCQFIFYSKLYRIEIRRPSAGGPKAEENYLLNELHLLNQYFERNLDFYQYYRSGAAYMDEQYFTRARRETIPALDTFYLNADPLFCTSHDFEVSKILAHQLLQQFLMGEIEQLQQKAVRGGTPIAGLPDMQWTGTLAGLYELIYGIKAVGAVNNGNITIIQLAELFETIFKVNLKNIYRGHQENRIKGDRTAFMKLMIRKLEEEMDKSDENPRYR